MTQRYTKNELIKLQKDHASLIKSKKVLEERQKKLISMYRSKIRMLREVCEQYNELLAKARDVALDIAKSATFFDVENDAKNEGENQCSIEWETFMGKRYAVLGEYEFPIIKSGMVSDELKRQLRNAMKNIIDKSKSLDREVKRASIIREEVKRNGRKMEYIEHVLIPKSEEKIDMIKKRFDEKEREELTKMKKFKRKVAK